MNNANTPDPLFDSLPLHVQQVLVELEQLNETYEEQLPATLSPKLIEQGVMHTVKLWSVPRTTGEVLYSLVTEHQPALILELGTSAGYSALWMGAAARQYGGRVVSVDSSARKIEMAEKAIAQAEFTETIECVEASIFDFLQSWAYVRDDKKIDAVFIDADKKNTERFYEMLLPHLAADHLLMIDDAVKYEREMHEFITRIQRSADYESTLLPQDHGLFIAWTSS
jgi:predicted O-methyltransferase YrrM